jgi:putative phosphoesterase
VIVGILSDTHDRADASAAGVAALRAAGAEFFVHCGDVGSERILDHLAGLRAAFVFGNTDWDRAGLERYAQAIGIDCLGASGELVLGGKRFGVAHGDDAWLVKRWLAEQRHDYVLLGHSHVRDDDRVGRVRVINPGALHRAREKTVAVLDTTTDALRFIPIAAI